MKTCNGKCGWRPVLGVVAAGILACSISLHGAPPDNDGVTRGDKVGAGGVQSSLVLYPDGIPSSRIGRVAPVQGYTSAAELLRAIGETPLLILEGVDEPSAGMIASRTGGPGEECELDIECDSCDPCLTSECVAGACVVDDAVECFSCDDGVFCNGSELCDGLGVCVGIEGQVRFACDAGPDEGLGCDPENAEHCPDGDCVEEKMPIDPCNRWPSLICDEEAEAGSPGETGACVQPCDPEATPDTCDDQMECNGLEECTPQECVGGDLHGEVCTTNAQCAAGGGTCGGVCRTITPPPCGTDAVCSEGTPYACGWGRCCSGPACSREKLADCTGDWLAVGDRGNTPTDDDGDCDIPAGPDLPNAGEDFDCPEYSSGIVEGTAVLELLGPAGVADCRPYSQIGDDYKLAGCIDGDEWFEVTTIRFIGGFPDGVGSRMRVTFYDLENHFIEDVITEPSSDGTEVLRTVIFSEKPKIPCEGYMALSPAEEFSQDNLSSWWSTGAVQTGYNDPTKLWIDGAPCESCAEVTGQQILAFEIVGDYAVEPVGACCDADTGVCTEELRWDCDAGGNVYQGDGTGCIVCSNDPFVSCSTNDECIVCDGGERESEPCGANPNICPNGGTCNDTYCVGGTNDVCDDGDRIGEPCGTNTYACPGGVCDYSVTGNCVGGSNDGDACNCPEGDETPAGECYGDPCGCPGATCDDTGACNTPREACAKSACCEPSSGACQETSGGFCTDSGTCSVTTATTCAIDANCPPGETCEGAVACQNDAGCSGTCEAPCEPGSISQGFGTDCFNNCCEQPIYGGWDNCALARTNVAVIQVTGTEQTITFTGDNKQATFDDHSSETCEAGIFAEDGATRDRGWWHAFSLDSADNCSDIRIDMCCTEPIHQPQWAFLYSTCDPCGGVINNTTAPSPIGNSLTGNDRGDPFCLNEDNLWQTWTRLRDGIYYHPIYTATGGHFGQYQLHITALECPTAACCLPDGTCELHNELDCDDAGGYWLGFGNIPSDMAAVISCDFGACDTGSCCVGPGDCRDADGTMDYDLCVNTLGGTYYGGAECDYPKQPCPACEIEGVDNCQYTVGIAAFNYTGSSDLGAPPTGTAVVDDFIPSGDSLKTVCVWGTYMDGAGGGPGTPPYGQYECVYTVPVGTESFRVRVYEDSDPPGRPGDLVGEELVSGSDVARGVVDSPGFFWTGFNVQGWTLELPNAITLTSGVTHWLEVASNRNICPNGECIDGECASGDRVGQSCNPDSGCWWSWYQTYQEDGVGNAWSLFGTDDRPEQGMAVGSGYVPGGGKSVDVQFCLGGPSGPLNFTLPDPPTGCCCDCEGGTTDGQTLVECELDIGGVWTRDALCTDPGVCFNEGDDCSGAGGQIAEGGLNCQSAPGESGALVVSDGVTGFDTTCYTTDGPEYPDGGTTNALGKDIWFAYTTSTTGELIASMCMSGNGDGGYDSFMAMYHDPDFPDVCLCPGSQTPVGGYLGSSDEGCNGIADEGSGYMDGQIVFPGECYLVRLGGWSGTAVTAGAGRGLVDIAVLASECFPSSPPEPERLDLPFDPISQKVRYLSFEAQDVGHTGYARVTFVDLPAPYDNWNGVQMFVEPPEVYCENAAQTQEPTCSTSSGGLPTDDFLASTLSCSPPDDPYDWAAAGVVHVFHEGIVPDGIYHIQIADDSCSTGVESSYSDPLVMQCSRWGDAVQDCASTPCKPPDGSAGIVDVTAILDKWKNLPGNLRKVRADYEGSPAGDHRVPDQAINITDVTYCLGAFLGDQYPGPGFPAPGPRPCTGFIAGAP